MLSVRQIDELRHCDAAAALRLAQSARQRDSSPYLLAVLGSCYRTAGELSQARRVLNRAVRISPKRSFVRGDALQRLAYVAMDQADWRFAEKIVRWAMTIYAELGEVDRGGQTLYDLGLIYYFREEYAASLDVLNRALTKLDQDNFRSRFSAHLTCANIHLQLDNEKKALQEALAAELLAPNAGNISHRSADFLVEFYENRGQYEKAYQKADELFERYALAGRWNDAPQAALWSLRLRIKNDELAKASKVAVEFLGACLIHLKDPLASQVILELLRVGISGRPLTLEAVNDACRQLEPAACKKNFAKHQ